MRILVSSLYFAPDYVGIAPYATDMATYLSENGHDVTVVTGFPFYPQWKKRPEDQRRLLAQEEPEPHLKVLRGYLYVPHEVSAARRIWHDITFILFAFVNFWRAGRQDCIVVIAPPSLLGVLGVFFKWWWGAQLVIHVQDFQADAAQTLGMVKAGFLVRGLAWLENWSYRHSTWVATITQGMWERLCAKGIDPHRLDILYNWIDVANVAATGQPGQFLAAHPELAGKFVVAYSGNVGIKQGLDVMLEAADWLRDDPRVHFILIGEGADKARIVALAAEKKLHNLTFLPFLESADYYSMLEDVGALLVAQRAYAGNVFFPSKLLGIMAKGRPLLVAADLNSELAQVIAGAGCGLVSPAEDAAGLAANIERLVESPLLAHELGCQGRRQVQAYDRAVVLAGFLARVTRGGSHKPEVLAQQLAALQERQRDEIESTWPDVEHA